MTEETEQEKLIRHLRGVRPVVINACHGGFGLSYEARVLYLDRSRIDYTVEDRESRFSTQQFGPHILVNGESFIERDIPRDDPVLVSVVHELGKRAWGRHAELKIVEIPAAVKWQIDEYDGWEWVAETHRTWK
jgi:hypothetical protein